MKKCIIISLASTKGGTGKTTICNALASYLTELDKRVLLIDLNSQMDLTLEFDLSKQQLKDSSIYRAFDHDTKNPQAPFPKNFKPAHINKYMDILTSSKNLRNVSDLMRNSKTMAPYVLGHVISNKSGLGLENKYDYILIDTHNDKDIPVQNAFVMSDYVIAPVIPSRFGINSVPDTINLFNYLKRHLLNPMTQTPFIHAKLRFIGNLIRFNTKSSHDFIKAVRGNPQFIALIHELELFNKAQTFKLSIFDCAKKEAKQGKKNDLRTLNTRIVPQLKKIVTEINK